MRKLLLKVMVLVSVVLMFTGCEFLTEMEKNLEQETKSYDGVWVNYENGYYNKKIVIKDSKAVSYKSFTSYASTVDFSETKWNSTEATDLTVYYSDNKIIFSQTVDGKTVKTTAVVANEGNSFLLESDGETNEFVKKASDDVSKNVEVEKVITPVEEPVENPIETENEYNLNGNWYSSDRKIEFKDDKYTIYSLSDKKIDDGFIKIQGNEISFYRELFCLGANEVTFDFLYNAKLSDDGKSFVIDGEPYEKKDINPVSLNGVWVNISDDYYNQKIVINGSQIDFYGPKFEMSSVNDFSYTEWYKEDYDYFISDFSNDSIIISDSDSCVVYTAELSDDGKSFVLKSQYNKYETFIKYGDVDVSSNIISDVFTALPLCLEGVWKSSEYEIEIKRYSKDSLYSMYIEDTGNSKVYWCENNPGSKSVVCMNGKIIFGEITYCMGTSSQEVTVDKEIVLSKDEKSFTIVEDYGLFKNNNDTNEESVVFRKK